MDDDTTRADKQRVIGGALLFVALCCAALAFSLWQKATDTADSDALTADLTQAMLVDDGNLAAAARVDTDPEPDRTAPIALGAVAAVAAVCGTIALSTIPHGTTARP